MQDADGDKTTPHCCCTPFMLVCGQSTLHANSRDELIQLLHAHCAVPQDYCAALHGPESAKQERDVAGPVRLVLTL